jgi:hypothetical protein
MSVQNPNILRRSRRWLPALIVALALAVVGSAALAAPGTLARLSSPAASPPTLISYQGFVKTSGDPYSGVGYFKFAIVDAASGDGALNYWANDGAASGRPAAAVALDVTGGLFDVLLGDTSLAGMAQPITPDVFAETATYLRVWFSPAASGPFQALDPNQRIASVAYALRAEHALTAEVALGVGNNTGPCTAALVGSLRWTGSAYQLCDGIYWRTVQLSNARLLIYRANEDFDLGSGLLFGGSIGGRAGADAHCEAATNKPAGYNHYRALISVNADDEIRDMPANYGVPTFYPVHASSPSAALIATDWADLLDGTILVDLRSAGLWPSGSTGSWWSGSNPDGSLHPNNCGGWTASSGDGRIGANNRADSGWISAAPRSCDAIPAGVLCLAW